MSGSTDPVMARSTTAPWAAEHLHALDRGKRVDVDRTLERDLELPECSSLERGDVVDGDDAPLAQHGDARRGVLDLRQHVRRQEDRDARRGALEHHRSELALQQRIESAGGLVEDQELGVVHERLHEPDLLTVALRQIPNLAVQRQVEAIGQRVDRLLWHSAPQPSEMHQDRPHGLTRPQRELAGQIAHPAADGHRVAPAVETEHGRRARGRMQQVEDRADERGLARAVRPEEPEDLAGRDLQVDRFDAAGLPVALGQAVSADRRRVAHRATR